MRGRGVTQKRGLYYKSVTRTLLGRAIFCDPSGGRDSYDRVLAESMILVTFAEFLFTYFRGRDVSWNGLAETSE